MYNNYACVYLHNMLFMRMDRLGLIFFFNWPMLEPKNLHNFSYDELWVTEKI